MKNTILILILTIFTGCTVITENPLKENLSYNNKEKLEGEWLFKEGHIWDEDDTKFTLRFTGKGTGNYESRVLDDNDKLKVIKGEMIFAEGLNADFVSVSIVVEDEDESAGYLLFRYKLKPNGNLLLSVLDSAPFLEAIRDGKLKGEIIEQKFGEVVKISDTPNALMAFLNQMDFPNIKEDFNSGEVMLLERVSAINITEPIAGNQTVDVGETDKLVPPEPIHRVEPEYPDSLRKAGITGTVVFECVIGSDGTIDRVEIIESPHELFSIATIEAVKQWKFKPGTVNGKPVNTHVRIPLPYNIRNQKPSN